MEYRIETKCQHQKEETCDKSGAVCFPIYQSATNAHKGVGEGTGYDYSRLQNPTREQLERQVAELENAADAFAFTSGMAAITALMVLFKPGDHIIIDYDLYGGSIRLFEEVCMKNGVHFSRVNCREDHVESYIQAETKAVFIETPTNPMMHITDIRRLSETAEKHQILFIVDNTFLTPYFQNPLDLGADIVVHSGSKYLGGHNDTLSGFLVTKSESIAEQLQFIIKTVGSGLAPFDSWLIMRGIKTLAVRMEQAQKNAMEIAVWLKNQPNVKQVCYPGLPESKGYEICKNQSRGFGSMITFEVTSAQMAHSVLKNVRLIQFAESLGGTETLITYPITQTHADVSKELLETNGITDKILRLSVGLEAAADLIAELDSIFKMNE